MIAPDLIQCWPSIEDRADLMAAEELSSAARSFAEVIAGKCRHVPDTSRREMAEYLADAVANALYDVNGDLNRDAFLTLCEVSA